MSPEDSLILNVSNGNAYIYSVKLAISVAQDLRLKVKRVPGIVELTHRFTSFSFCWRFVVFALFIPSKIQTDNKMDIEKEVKKVKFANPPSVFGQKGRRPEKVCRTLVRWRDGQY